MEVTNNKNNNHLKTFVNSIYSNIAFKIKKFFYRFRTDVFY